MSGTPGRWYGIHVFLSDPDRTERFIVHALAPLAKRLIDTGSARKWFFLRYWDGGPHVRMRFLELADEQAVLARLTDEAAKYTVQNPVGADEYYSGHGFDGQPVEVERLQWHGEGAVAPIVYEPETMRYGGRDALAVNESLFQVSSNLALALIRSTPLETAPAGFQKRVSISLMLMMATVLAFRTSLDTLSRFFENYARFWEGYAGVDVLRSAIARDLDEGRLNARVVQLIQEVESDTGSALQRVWVGRVRQATAAFRKHYMAGALISPLTGQPAVSHSQYEASVLSMLGSQMHMLNNRLAITPQFEYHLAGMIAGAVQRPERAS